MAKVTKKRTLWDRMVFGSEKDEGYARATLPSNRWELFWDIFKGRFSKLIIINLLMLLFFLPVIAIIAFRYIGLTNFGATYPFNQPFGVGYQAPLNLTGLAENITLSVDMIAYAFMPIAIMIASIGVSGGAYVIRNMVWTEGIFVANDFWRGIKQNFKNMLLIGVVYSLVFYVTIFSASIASQASASATGNAWIFIICEVAAYVILALYSIMTLHMITMSVTYELRFRDLFKNTFMFTLVLLPQNLFFIVLGFLPFIFLFFGGLFLLVGVIAIILIGLSLILLVWTNYCQWAFDKYINDKVTGAKKRRGMYEKIKGSESDSLRQYRESIAVASLSSLKTRPIKPITDDELKIADLPTSFNRSDLQKLAESKQAIYDDHAQYVEEHKNDPQYQIGEEEKMFQLELEEKNKRIEKAKKELAKRNKNKRK